MTDDDPQHTTDGSVPGLSGDPEGTEDLPTRIPKFWLAMAFVFAIYLLFRLVQGVLWLAHHL